MRERRASPPFIGDYVVVSFDEARLAAALQTLAEAGSRVQTILFTHHRHVVDIAHQRLGDRLDFIPLGKNSGT